MKRFEFKLKALLNFRKHLERMAQQDMAKTVMEIAACEQQIDSLETTHGHSTQQLEQIVEKGVGAKEFKQHQSYIEAVIRMIGEEKEQKFQLDKVLEKKRLALKKRSIDKKAMERLREKQAKAYNQELLVAEQKELDEISSLKKAREISNDTH
ncbi:MAG: flagellar export protein FliJ [Proteobacteria bacterium]|nr:flagellar export protein FliJ [Desulfobacula sp.]MBU4130871.1 flagellar export protein FliJ [Pseudomonadota bacterium]